MSKISFKTFCIEKYADYKKIPSNKVYALFEKNGVLKMLDEDYDVLHGFGFEYIVRDIDHYLGGDASWNHGTIRAATMQTIIKLIVEKYQVNEDTALKMFYESHIGAAYADDETGLYGQSANYVFSLFNEEHNC